MKLALSDVLAAVAALSVALPLGCSASQTAAPPEDASFVPPANSVVASGDARSAPGVDGAPVRSSTPAAGPASAPTTTAADRRPTTATEPASPAPTSADAAPPAVTAPGIDSAGAETESTPRAVPEPASTDPAPGGTELTAAPSTGPEIDPAGAETESTPRAVPEPASTDPAPGGTELTAAPSTGPEIDPAGAETESTPRAVPEPVSADEAPTSAEPASATEVVSGATLTGAAPGVGGPASTSPAPAPSPPAVLVLRHEPLSFVRALDVAARLAPDIVVPNSCEPAPLGDPTLLPNAVREYRSGTHQGVDFMCPERGRAAIAALDGHVVVAVGDYENPSPADLDEVLATARRLQATPPYTLVMLYGNHVVVDHGIIDNVGHVVSIYAHLDALDPAIGIGRPVEAGQLLGWVGNSGTNTAAAGALDWSLHLHWELHVDDQYLGAGLSATETRTVYATLFDKSAEQRTDHTG